MTGMLRRLIRSLGFDIVRYRPPSHGPLLPDDLSERDRDILRRIMGYTMTGIDRQVALVSAVRHLARSGIEGCFVECGVWRGGSSMAAALTLLQEGVTDRDLYLFDTFTGMTSPTEVDKTADGTLAQTHLERDAGKVGYWCVAGLDDVRRNMATTGYPADRIHFVEGPVEETIPRRAPSGPIALLRLDTDWYESTRHELIHLFAHLVRGGVLIVDDYGHWAGARQAVDEFLAEQPHAYYLHRIDYTGRLLIKQ